MNNYRLDDSFGNGEFGVILPLKTHPDNYFTKDRITNGCKS